jgi:hypothetical protein
LFFLQFSKQIFQFSKQIFILFYRFLHKQNVYLFSILQRKNFSYTYILSSILYRCTRTEYLIYGYTTLQSKRIYNKIIHYYENE